MQLSCSCHNRNVLCSDTKFVATGSFYTHASGNCHGKHFSFHCRDRVFYVEIGFLLFFHNFCCDRIFFCRHKISFMVLVSSLTICCNIKIFVATYLTWIISILF